MDILWEKCLNIIKENVSQQNFDTWIRPIRITSLQDNCILLSVPNRFFKDWLKENYYSLLKDSLVSLVGTDINIDFEISQNPEKQNNYLNNIMSDRSSPTMGKMVKVRINPSLNPNYNFDRFIVGASNQFAHAACIAVSEQPAKNYNPLFIYGGVGLGKTHLLNAIGLRTMAIHKNINVLYVSAEEFMNELVNSIRYDKMPKFREKFRQIECLLMDDIHFLAGKERTQEEFFHTFNTLHDSGKQIVVTSDKFPKDIPNLERRLRSRFEWGLIADIQPPEMETRIAIVEKKVQENNIILPSTVVHYIASNAESNIRELEGSLIRIAAYASLTRREIDMALVQEVLKKIVNDIKEKVTVEEIVKIVAGKFGVKIDEIKAAKKNKSLTVPRHIAMYLARKLTTSSYPDIGEKIGGRDHSTVIYACNKIKKLMDMDNNIKIVVQGIEDTLHKG
ncbi:MAG: chromosomal replication initiator protein DnaA [Syntrophobacteraceae bacterium CG23_combo_of_CG06-09_8_20_14_all_50_8]|nr:MAG: chromosomal replication initiator protein DnaA [Syntrophobacteraceae bacterium CG23_combo_of_CG06-09_8_20_14_all_50_8]